MVRVRVRVRVVVRVGVSVRVRIRVRVRVRVMVMVFLDHGGALDEVVHHPHRHLAGDGFVTARVTVSGVFGCVRVFRDPASPAGVRLEQDRERGLTASHRTVNILPARTTPSDPALTLTLTPALSLTLTLTLALIGSVVHARAPNSRTGFLHRPHPNPH